MIKNITYAWNFIFDHEVSPLRNIPDISTRHYILQILGFMWAIASSAALGSYTILAASILGHAFLIGAAAITIATYTAAATRPEVFKFGRRHGAGRQTNGEHE